jgi:two-component system chemotaxis response regulator CheB
MPAGYTKSLAERLVMTSHLSVREATLGDHLAAGRALVASGDFHVKVSRSGRVELDEKPRRGARAVR